MMSAPGLSLWRAVWAHTAEMVRTYPERGRHCSKPGQLTEVIDSSLKHFTVPVGMTGREGVLCLGPLSMAKVVHAYLEERGLTKECMPSSFKNFWCWSSLTGKKKSWAKAQRSLFYRRPEDAAKHFHYSQLSTPIVSLVSLGRAWEESSPRLPPAGLAAATHEFKKLGKEAGAVFQGKDAFLLVMAAKRYRDPETGRVWIQDAKSGMMQQDDWFYVDDLEAWHVWKDPHTENLWWSQPNGRCFCATCP